MQSLLIQVNILFTKVPPIPFEESPVREPEFEEIPAHLLAESQPPPARAIPANNEDIDLFAQLMNQGPQINH